MKHIFRAIGLSALIIGHNMAWALSCDIDGYQCKTIHISDSWLRLFPKKIERLIVQKINRQNTPLVPGQRIMVPQSYQKNLIAHTPLPKTISTSEKVVFIELKLQAWGAYNQVGKLVKWGPISSGRSNCPKNDNCNTPKGTFHIERKKGKWCVSNIYPKRADGFNGGAPMPYCMHFHKTYAIHGSNELGGYPASHGCIRVFNQDAKWLNKSFINLPNHDQQGTKVIIQ